MFFFATSRLQIFSCLLLARKPLNRSAFAIGVRPPVTEVHTLARKTTTTTTTERQWEEKRVTSGRIASFATSGGRYMNKTSTSPLPLELECVHHPLQRLCQFRLYFRTLDVCKCKGRDDAGT